EGDLAAAQCSISLAYVEFERRGFDVAWSRLHEVERSIAAPAPALGVALSNQRGVLLLRVGRMVEARTEFDRAVSSDDEPSTDRCKALLNRAVASMELGEIRQAREDLSRC